MGLQKFFKQRLRIRISLPSHIFLSIKWNLMPIDFTFFPLCKETDWANLTDSEAQFLLFFVFLLFRLLKLDRTPLFVTLSISSSYANWYSQIC